MTGSDGDGPIEVDSRTVSCGGGGVLGHPNVYLTMQPNSRDIVCPYCGRRFVLAADAKEGADH
jgi:uncharacterized Zn-finger protein